MTKDIETFNCDLEATSQKKLVFIIKALIAADHLDQYIVERAMELADTIKTE